MASPRLYAEVWRRPGHATFGKVIADVPVISCSGTAPVNGIGEGRITIPKSYDRLDEILKPDPVTPANNVSSLVRVFSENSATPIYEFIPAVFTGEQDKADPDIEIVGPAVGVIWGYARVEAWDWTGADSEYSRWPDWIWGGRNVLGALESVYVPAVTKLHRDPIITGGTFTIGVSFNSGAIQTTSALAWNITASAMRTALIALSNVDNIEVSGSGSEVDPWRIQTDLPEGEYVLSVNSGSLTPSGLVMQDRETIGAILPVGWTNSFNPVNNISHGSVDVLRAEPLAAYTPVPACATTGIGIYFDAGAGDFPGIQKIVAVKPGGRYYAKIMARPIGGTFTARLVIRDLYENGIAVDPSFDSGTVLPADTWTQMYIPIVSMPNDVDRAIYRFASVSGSNAPPIVVACMELREGMPPTTWGDILTQLWLDATSDHAGRQVWQIGAGATNFLTLDFSASVDSAGNAWTHPEVSITLKRGQSYLRVLGEAQKQGYETRIVPNNVATGTWKLQVYNIGTMGVIQTAISTGPSIQGGRDVSRRDLRRFLPPATDVAVEAGGQNIARSRSTTAITALGRIEQYVPNQDLGSLVEAATAAAQGVAVNLQRSQSLSYVLSPTTLDPEPFVAYNAADTLYVLDPPDVPTRSARRIKSLGFAFTKTTTEYPIQLESDSFVGVQGIAQSVDFLLKEFKAIRERPDETTDALNYFPQGGTGTPTIVIAAYNATQTSKDKADFVCTGFADEGYINIALGILAANPISVGGRIVLTEGDYYLTTTVVLTTAGARFEGMGEGYTRLHSGFGPGLTTAVNLDMFRVEHTAGNQVVRPVSWSHLALDGQKSIQTSGTPRAIYCEPGVSDSSIVSLDNVDIHDWRGYGIHFDRSVNTGQIDNCRIHNNTLAGIGIGREGLFYVTNSQIYLNTTYGIEAPGAIISIIGCDIFSNTLDGFSAGGVLQQAGQRIIGNRFYFNRTGIVLDGYEATIEGNIIFSNTAGGIDAYGNNPMNIIGNNVYSNATFGIQLNGGAGNKGGICSGNVCELNGTYGINVVGSHWLVTGNHVSNNGRTTTNTYDGIRVTSGSYSNIMGNIIRQNATAPVQKYGINVLVAAVCTKVVGNDYGDTSLYGTDAYGNASTTTRKVWPADGFYGDNFTTCGEETPPGEVEGGEDDVTAPAVPVGLTAAAGDTFIYLNWTSNTELDLASYKVYKATASGGPFTFLVEVDDSEYTDTGLVNGTPLWFKITAVDDTGNESTMTASVTATPAVPPAGVAPAVPTGLAITTTGDTLVTLNWNDNTETDLANYKVYRATASGGPYTLVGSPTVSNFTDTGLTNGTQYWFKVSAIDTGANESAQSSSVTTTPTAGGGVVGRPTPTVIFNAGNLYSAAKVTAEAAGTVFGFEIDGGTGSTGRYENAAIPTKDNNEYVFDPGTVLDGNGTTPLAFLTDAATTGVKIWDCEWTDYTGQDGSGNNNDKGGGAIRLRDAWELIDCYGHHNKYAAFRIDGDDVVITGGDYSYNGQYGFAGGNCDDCTVDGAEVHHNGGIGSLDIGGDTGGCKIVHSERFTFVNVEAHHNLATGTQGGNGLWTDINNKDTLYDSCNVHDNEGAGIFHEVSCDFEIRDCTLTNNGQDNSGGGIHPVKANIQISNSGGNSGWIHDNVITITNGSLGFYGISLFNSNHFQWTAANVTKCCLGVRNVLVEDNTLNLSGSQWKAAIAITGNLPTARHASQFCGQVAITASGSNNRIRNNAETLSGGAHTSTPYIRAGVRVSAAAWAGFGYT